MNWLKSGMRHMVNSIQSLEVDALQPNSVTYDGTRVFYRDSFVVLRKNPSSLKSGAF